MLTVSLVLDKALNDGMLMLIREVIAILFGNGPTPRKPVARHQDLELQGGPAQKHSLAPGNVIMCLGPVKGHDHSRLSRRSRYSTTTTFTMLSCTMLHTQTSCHCIECRVFVCHTCERSTQTGHRDGLLEAVRCRRGPNVAVTGTNSSASITA